MIAELCDEVVVMYAGEVIEYGDVHDIFHRAAHPYTRALLECDPARVLERTRYLPTIPGDVPDLHLKPTGCVFASRCPQVFDHCKVQRPPQHRVGADGHLARCHLLDAECRARGGRSRSSETGARGGGADIQGRREQLPLLEVQDLRVRFRIMSSLKARLKGLDDPFVDAVLGTSLTLKTGETLGLVGESGSGKTTLGRAILGLVDTHSGSVRFRGQELTGLCAQRVHADCGVTWR